MPRKVTPSAAAVSSRDGISSTERAGTTMPAGGRKAEQHELVTASGGDRLQRATSPSLRWQPDDASRRMNG
jgi:hypothetical protein